MSAFIFFIQHFLNIYYVSHTIRYRCQLKIVTCHLPLQGWSQYPPQSLTFNTPWKEFRVEIRNEALSALGKTGRRGLQIEKILWTQFLQLLLSRKALKSLMVTSAPHDQRQTSAKCVLDACPSFTKVICNTDLPSYLFGASTSGLSEMLSPGL